MRMYVVEWKNGSRKGNLYIRAEDEEQALNKAITDYWRTVDDIVSIKQVHSESSYRESSPTNDRYVCNVWSWRC